LVESVGSEPQVSNVAFGLVLSSVSSGRQAKLKRRKSLPIEAALHGEAAGEPVFGFVPYVVSLGFLLASPVLAIFNLQKVDQVGVGLRIEGEERSGRVKVDLNGFRFSSLHQDFVVVGDIKDVEVPASDFIVAKVQFLSVVNAEVFAKFNTRRSFSVIAVEKIEVSGGVKSLSLKLIHEREGLLVII